MKRTRLGMLVVAAAAAALVMPPTATAAEIAAPSAGPCEPPLVECVKELLAGGCEPCPVITCEPPLVQCIKDLLCVSCGQREQELLARGAAEIACGKPVVDCVRELLVWLVTYDPCLTCGFREEIERACQALDPLCH